MSIINMIIFYFEFNLLKMLTWFISGSQLPKYFIILFNLSAFQLFRSFLIENLNFLWKPAEKVINRIQVENYSNSDELLTDGSLLLSRSMDLCIHIHTTVLKFFLLTDRYC